MSTKITSLYAELSAKDTLTPALKGAGNAIGSLKSSLAALGVGLTFAGIVRSLKDVIDTTVDYASEVRKLNQINGDTSENNSRLIQTLDDYKVSTESIITAQRALAKQGKDMTIPTLMEMSDAYLKLSSRAERQNFLTENLGKSGSVFAEVMTRGSAAIQAQSDSIAKNLILTDAMIQKNRDYEIAQDDLNDAIAGMKIAVGNELVPVITSLVNNLNITITKAPELGSKIDELKKSFIEGSSSVEEYRKKVLDFGNGLDFSEKVVFSFTESGRDLASSVSMTEAEFQQLKITLGLTTNETHNMDSGVQALRTSLDLTTQATEDAAAALAGVVSEAQAQTTAVGTLQGIYEEFTTTTADLEAQQKDLNAQLAEATIKYGENSQQVRDIKAALEENNVALGAAADAFEMQSRRAILAMMQEAAYASGDFTNETQDALLNLGVAWGIYSTTAVNEMQMMRDPLQNHATEVGKIKAYTEYLVAHPTTTVTYDIFVKTTYIGDPYEGTGATTQSQFGGGKTGGNGDVTEQRWSGGDVGVGSRALVGDKPGGIPTPYSEIIEPLQGGGVRVYNAQESRSIMGNGMRSFASGGQMGGGNDELTSLLRALPDMIGIAIRDNMLQATR